jgi:MFS family permease
MYLYRAFHFPPFRLPGTWGVLGNSFLRNLAMGMVGIFIPLYVYELTGDLGMIFLFYMIVYAVVVASSIWVGAVVTRIGIDKSSMVASLLRAGFLGLLIFGKANLGFLWAGAILWGLVIPFYWFPYRYTVVVSKNEDGKFGEEVGKMRVVDKIAAAIGPFIGGLIIVSFGFTILYIVSIILAILSPIPLLLDSYSKRGMRFSVRKISSSLERRKNWPIFLAWLGYGMETVIYGVAWWVFVFLMIRDYEVMGAVSSGALLLTLLVCWWAGGWIDKKGPGILKIGVLVNSLNWLLRPFLRTASLIFGSDLLYQLVANFVWTPYEAVFFEIAEKKRRLEFIIKREIWVNLGGFLACFLVLIFLALRFSWSVIFGLGILGLFFSSLILEFKKKFEKFEV